MTQWRELQGRVTQSRSIPFYMARTSEKHGLKVLRIGDEVQQRSQHQCKLTYFDAVYMKPTFELADEQSAAMMPVWDYYEGTIYPEVPEG